MHFRRNLSPSVRDLERAELDHLLLTVAEVIERLSEHGLRAAGTAFADYLAMRFGLDYGWFDLEEREKNCSALLRHLRSLPSYIRARRPRRRSNALSRRLDWLGRVVGLNDVERDGLAVLVRHQLFHDWATLVELIDSSGHISVDTLSLLTGHGKAAVDHRFHAGARLSRTGLVRIDDDGEIRPDHFLIRIARARVSRPADLQARLMPEAPESMLVGGDFDHLGEDAALALRLLARGEGASILLYGPPGTGKTQFALHAVRQAGLVPVMAGMEDRDGGEPSRSERIAHLSILRELMRGESTHAIIADEADDMLHFGTRASTREHHSKAWLNAFVDASGPPTVWIVNNVDALPDTVVRRMDIVVRFDFPTQAVRSRIVERHARAKGLSLGEGAVASLATLPASPAVLETAVSGAARLGGGAEEARVIGAGLVEALTGRAPVAVSLPAQYDPALARADCDLDALAARLTAAPDKGWSLLLHGPSGTGKSAYARHIAQRMGVDLIEERGSDLLDAFVGGTERLIAAAFARAARQRAVLLIDEADDFLSDRRDAARSWERTMVNEMLRQMENLRAPFIATTNFAQNLDPATRRRFTLQAGFLTLDETRASALFVSWFGKEPPAGARLANLTPGDFTLVARRAELLGEGDVCKILKWLAEEAAHRVPPRGPAGFRAGTDKGE